MTVEHPRNAITTGRVGNLEVSTRATGESVAPACRGCLETYYHAGLQPSFICGGNSWGFAPD